MTLLELLQLMRKHLKLVILLPIVCALAMGVYSYAFMANTYTASTSMYVLAKQTSANSDNAANILTSMPARCSPTTCPRCSRAIASPPIP